MIDIVEALDLLDRCLRDHRASHGARPRAHRYARFGYVCAPTSGDIVTAALNCSGITGRRLSTVGASVRAGSAGVGGDLGELTLGARVVLYAAAHCGSSDWSAAVDAASRAAARFSELVAAGLG